jgi:hypothetical protein
MIAAALKRSGAAVPRDDDFGQKRKRRHIKCLPSLAKALG